MARLATRALALASILVAGVAAAHPGHGTPHLLHEADAILGWWVVGVLGTALAFGLLLARRRR